VSADLAAEFPRSTWTELPSADRHTLAVRYMRAMWGDRRGVIAFAVGLEPFSKNGKYSHKSFSQRFYNCPDDIELAATEAMQQAAGGADVYVAPMLRLGRERKKDNGAGGRWAWADLDGPLDEGRLTILRSLGGSARVVSSGTGHHAYFRLDSWTEPDAIEATNKALRDVLGADAKWSNESLLRLPGTFNRKPLVFHGKSPALVQAVTL